MVRGCVFLFESKRYAASMYLGGFVIECLLKSALWNRREEPAIHTLIFKSHDLEKLLVSNKWLESKMQDGASDVHDRFVNLTGWTVRFRYNPARPTFEDATMFMKSLKEVRAWLRSQV
jgi:HEPN domain-containing protein